MRNGNYILFTSFTAMEVFLSYLWGMETRDATEHVISLSCSYPTYEEWKQYSITCVLSFFKSSYPTYEEWKHRKMALYIWSWNVLILPMRNGNTIIALCHLSPTFLFLSYLWGMETSSRYSKNSFFGIWFLSYLWGMETF